MQKYFVKSKDRNGSCYYEFYKGEWDKKDNLQDIHTFNRKWIRRCYRILKDTGSIFISGTFHNMGWSALC